MFLKRVLYRFIFNYLESVLICIAHVGAGWCIWVHVGAYLPMLSDKKSCPVVEKEQTKTHIPWANIKTHIRCVFSDCCSRGRDFAVIDFLYIYIYIYIYISEVGG